MLKMKSFRIPSKPSSRPHRLGILLVAVLISFTIFGLSLSRPDGMLAPLEKTFAQASGSVFGIEANPLDASGGLNLITQTQTAWVRGPVVFWNDIETSEGVYNWSNLGEVPSEVQNAVSNGLEPIVVVRGTPSWAQKYPTYTCGPIDSTKFDAFANFMGELITSSPLASLNVKYWELWNEPDVSRLDVPSPTFIWYGCWGESGDTQYYGGGYYGDMLKVVYPAIKTADPQAQVLVGGLLMDCDPNQPPSGKVCTSSKFLEGILANNAANAFDGISYHAYDYYGNVYGTYNNPNWGASWNTSGPCLVNKAGYLNALLDQYNVSGKYLLNSENALLCDTCNSDTDFENTKAYYLVESYAAAMAQGLRANLWFSMLGEWGRNNGLLENPFAVQPNPPLPAFYAYQFAAQELDGATFVGNINNFLGISGYEFAKSNRHVWLMWAPAGGNVTVTLRAIPLNIFDVDGDPITVTGEQIVLTREPYFVEMPASVPRVSLPVLTNNFYTLTNGDFENNQSGWQFVNNGLPSSIVSTTPTDPSTGAPDTYIPAGAHSAILGDPNYPCTSMPLGYAEIRQTFTVPNTANAQVWLDFDYIIYSQDASTRSDLDRFEVYLQDGGNPVLRFSDGNMINDPVGCSEWRRVPGSENLRDGKANGWATASIDISASKGHTITIYFQNYSRYDNYYNTYTYLDNVRMREAPIP